MRWTGALGWVLAGLAFAILIMFYGRSLDDDKQMQRVERAARREVADARLSEWAYVERRKALSTTEESSKSGYQVTSFLV